MSLGILTLGMSLEWFSAMGRIAFDFDHQIIANVHLEKASRWVIKNIHESGLDLCGTPKLPPDLINLENNPVQILLDKNKLKILGLLDSGRVKYAGGSVLEISSLRPVGILNTWKNSNISGQTAGNFFIQTCLQVQDFSRVDKADLETSPYAQVSSYQKILIYHCEAGLCIKNYNNKRQVLVSGINDFSAVWIKKDFLKIHISENKYAADWVMKV